MATQVIVDPPPHSIKVDGMFSRRFTDRELRAALLSLKRAHVTRRRRYVYDRHGSPLGIVTFEPCRFSEKSGRRL